MELRGDHFKAAVRAAAGTFFFAEFSTGVVQGSRIQFIKFIRALCPMGLKEAKDIMEAAMAERWPVNTLDKLADLHAPTQDWR